MICRGGDIARGPRRRRDAGGATPSGVKKRPDCKPGYVDTIFSFFVAEGLRYGNPTPCRPVIYLCRAVARGLKRSTPRQMGEQPIRSSRPQGPEQRSTAGILDLATHQTVRRANSRWRPVGSYPAFSPLPRWGGGAPRREAPPPLCGAVVFCHVACTVARAFLLGRMVLFVARTFLTLTLQCGSVARDGPSGRCISFRVQYFNVRK